MALSTAKKREVITKFERGSGDTGSAEVQVALLSRRIEELNKHFASHRKDHSSRQGLLQMVGHRRKLLSYLKLADVDRYKKLIEDLGLRK